MTLVQHVQDVAATPDPKAVVLFDGVCNLCNRGVNWIIDHDPEARFVFVALQSDAGRALASKAGLDPDHLTTMVLVRDSEVLLRSDAALSIVAELRTRLSMLARVARLVPRFLRDGAYRVLALSRYRLFGRSDSCRVPTPELARRFPDPDDAAQALAIAGFGER